jgi:hypothetical protein
VPDAPDILLDAVHELQSHSASSYLVELTRFRGHRVAADMVMPQGVR